MLLNYLKLSLRLLARNPFFTFINIAGLAVGFAAFFTLWNYSSSELKADQFHPNYERTVRLGINWRSSEGYIKVGYLDPQTVHRIKMDYPEVEDYVRILFQLDFNNDLVGHSNKVVLTHTKADQSSTTINEKKIAYADPNLFDFFSIPLVYGEKNTILKELNTIALSTSMAYKYFGKNNPLGELLILNGSTALKVTGVFEDLPVNTHLDFDFVISNASMKNAWNSYTFPITQSFFLLKKGTDFEFFENKINSQRQIYWEEIFRYRPGLKAQMFVQPLAEVAYSNHYYGDHFRSKSRFLLITFSAVAIAILLMAWVNYINLTLARTTKRMKEVAMRKAAGAGTMDFLKQFLIESITINLIALALAFTLLQVARGPINIFLHLALPSFDSTSTASLLFFVVVVLIGIVVTGLYPAWMAMKYNPRKLLSLSSNKRTKWLPDVLAFFQYGSAIVLLLWVFVIYHQLSFMFNKGLGAGIESIANIESPVVRSESFAHQMEYFQNRLSDLNLVMDATTMNTMELIDNLQIKKSMNSSSVGVASNGGVSESFIPFFGINLIAGRNFRLNDRADVIILSHKATERLGFTKPDVAVGSKVYIAQDVDSKITDWTEVEIIGVMDDYRTSSYLSFDGVNSRTAKEGDAGIYMTYKNYLFSDMTPEYLAIKLDINNWFVTIPQIERLYNELFPGNAFTLIFQNSYIGRKYEDEKATRNQLVCFALLAIGISCLGLLGMISNKVLEKNKEIGIRKILGAELHQIAQLLLNTTVKQIAVATLIGIPVAYYLAQQYLEKFSERISLQWWHFALPVLILVMIMFLTIASVLWKAARSNPVEALKYE